MSSSYLVWYVLSSLLYKKTITYQVQLEIKAQLLFSIFKNLPVNAWEKYAFVSASLTTFPLYRASGSWYRTFLIKIRSFEKVGKFISIVLKNAAAKWQVLVEEEMVQRVLFWSLCLSFLSPRARLRTVEMVGGCWHLAQIFRLKAQCKKFPCKISL